MATDDPDIVATDDQGQKLSDTDVLVNGILPGSGGSTSVFSDDDSDGLFEQGKDGIDVPTVQQQQTRYTPTEISGNYTTAGESVIYADSSGGALTVTLASADATDGNVVEIYDVGESAGTNAITIATEGSETINPGGKSSIDISLNGGFVKLRCRAGNWFTDRNRQSNQAHANSVSAEQADITNETFVRFTRSADTSSTSAGTFVNAYDGESKDLRNEGSSGQIVPDESGEYLVYAGVQLFGGNTTSGDRLDIRVLNVTDNKSPSGGGRRQRNSTGSAPSWIVPFSVSLTAGKTYEVQVRNNDSSFIVNASVSTSGSVIRSVVG